MAPMVRISVLPARLLALRYGADLVYTDELIDKALIGCKRIENHALNTVDFVKADGRVVFRTHHSERDRLVVQIGSADPKLAVEAAQLVKNDCVAIDLNCGCPKKFSTHGGMGAALLKTPDQLISIVEALIKETNKPISCKIRLLPKIEDTIKLVQRLESIGVTAVTVHCRKPHQRPDNPGDWSVFKPIVDSVNIPIVANGDVYNLDDAAKIKTLSGVSSVMIARAAQKNFSIFRPSGPLPHHHVIHDYLTQPVKFTLMSTWSDLTTEIGERIVRSKTLRQICEIFDLHLVYDESVKTRTMTPESAIYDDQCPYVPRPILMVPNSDALIV